jgi:methyl-accepting chemotaxis protein
MIASSNDILNLSLGETIGIGVSTLLTAVIVYALRKGRELINNVAALMHVMITPKPTDLVPNPEPGVIDRLNEVHASVSLREATEGQLLRKVATLTEELDSRTASISKIDATAMNLVEVVAALDKKVSGLDSKVDGVVETVNGMDRKVTINGGKSKNLGDTVRRVAEERGVWEAEDGRAQGES